MILTKGKLVEYERQSGKPPIVAAVVELYGDGTCLVTPLCVLDDSNGASFVFTGAVPLRIHAELLRPARWVKALDRYHEANQI